MQKTLTLTFNDIPDWEEFREKLQGMAPPFSVEIRQGVNYHEIFDCDTLSDLFSEIDCSDYGPRPRVPFTVEVEEVLVDPGLSADEEPALTVWERNSRSAANG